VPCVKLIYAVDPLNVVSEGDFLSFGLEVIELLFEEVTLKISAKKNNKSM